MGGGTAAAAAAAAAGGDPGGGARKRPARTSVALMKVYPNELEAQAEFDDFTEWLQTFELYRGKHSDIEFEDEGRAVGKFKVSMRGKKFER